MEENKQKEVNQKVLKWVVLGLTGLTAVILIFSAGMFVGGQKARFSFRWAEQYQRNFAGPRQGFMGNWMNFPMGEMMGAHGVFGQIMKIDNSEIVIKGGDNVEKIVLVKDDTVIRSLQNNLKLSDLKVNDYIVVIGDPNDKGQIEAKFIRIMPPPPEENSFNDKFLPRQPGFSI